MVFTATPNQSIRDNDPAGIKADVEVTGVPAGAGLAVTVAITHTYRGDLVVELLKNGTLVKTLHNKTGGSQQNLEQTYTLTAAEVGAANGTWSLRVIDTAAQDAGTLNSVKLEFR